jgi:glyoxylase-like metal-dependent hydrolase (beta-lactamase superfamily II)
MNRTVFRSTTGTLAKDSLMKELAPDLFHLSGFPPNVINIYLAGETLIDAGTRYAAGRILRQLKGRTVSSHALTHAHPDHQGSSRVICDTLEIPLWCGAGEADAVESGDLSSCMPKSALSRFACRSFAGPACPVARRLHAGDIVAGFTVLDVPGHSPGQIAYWRESDRVLILGDVLNNMSLVTAWPGLHEPPAALSTDPARNRQSARKLAELEPALMCFGHGPPLRDTKRFLEFVASLKA